MKGAPRAPFILGGAVRRAGHPGQPPCQSPKLDVAGGLPPTLRVRIPSPAPLSPLSAHDSKRRCCRLSFEVNSRIGAREHPSVDCLEGLCRPSLIAHIPVELDVDGVQDEIVGKGVAEGLEFGSDGLSACLMVDDPSVGSSVPVAHGGGAIRRSPSGPLRSRQSRHRFGLPSP